MSRPRFTSAIAFGAIVLLCAVVVIVWVQFTQGAFDRRQRWNDLENGSWTIASTESPAEKTTARGKGKEYIEKSHLDDLGQREAVFVKPLKINPDDENRDEQGLAAAGKHHSGHFRHKSAEIWDPHPKYEIDAFGTKLVLELRADSKFVAPDLHIVSQGKSSAQRRKHDPKISGCYYTGKLRNDANSAITVSLCHGMTGYIRSSEANYYIEPAEGFTNGSLGTILHRIKKLPHSVEESNDVINFERKRVTEEASATDNGNETHSIVEDDFPEEIVEHSVKKRDVAFFGDEILYDDNNGKLPQTVRIARDMDWSSGYVKNSNEYFIKVLVVADSTMLDYHKNHEKLTNYILILMSHVALLFKEHTIGNAINVAVVHIVILDHSEDDFSNSLSQDMLKRFCEWKQRYIFDKAHDVALLLTRRTICKKQKSCTTLGVAEVDSVCRPSGCTIVRDKGLSTSYTIAHEFGHTLSMVHDDDSKCTAYNSGVVPYNNLMSRTTRNDSKPFSWSPCSRQFVTDFLDMPKAKCLLVPPQINEISSNYTHMLPGDTIEVDRQCELEFGPGHTRCHMITDFPPCVHLWCAEHKTETCITQYSPWAEGTRCGPQSWCFNRTCTMKTKREFFVPVDGGWGDWQPYGACSRTCGGGIAKSVRYCDRPLPMNGGTYCTGKSVRYMSCNTRSCDENAEDFRAIQCAQFNGLTKGVPNLTRDVQWVPKYGLGSPDRVEDYCRLYCKPHDSDAYYALKDKVIDGTKCGKSGLDICVNGMCRPGGCDNVLDSKNIFDDCGVCGGNNSQCSEIQGNYNQRAEQVSYNRVVRIPKGASNIKVVQFSYGSDENFLALRDGETGAYILNGNQMLRTQEIEVDYGKMKIQYSGSNAQPEWISTSNTKKLPKDLVVEVLSIERLSPPNITFNYKIGTDSAPSESSNSRYGVQLYQTSWSPCDSICDGKQKREPVCVDLGNGRPVHISYCDPSDVLSFTETQKCNTHCSLTWHPSSPIAACSSNCGFGYRKVHYVCKVLSRSSEINNLEVNIKNTEVDSRYCSKLLGTPPDTEQCYTSCNTTRWVYSPWSECSKTCGGGIHWRSAKCVDENNNTIADGRCDNKAKLTTEKCNRDKCPYWYTYDSSVCSVPCGGGYLNTTTYCLRVGGQVVDNALCDARTKPPKTRACNERACGRWAASDSFGPCSVTCGDGIEQRRFACKKFDSEEVLDEGYCRGIPKPERESRKCFKDCEKMAVPHADPDGQRRKYNVFNENSVYDRRNQYQWVAGNWSPCSKTCGDGGISVQTFHCRNKFGDEDPLMCDRYQVPDNRIRCNEDRRCPKWKVGDWSPKCDQNCERFRQVRCVDERMNAYKETDCDMNTRPQNSTKCQFADCPDASNDVLSKYFDDTGDRYRWKAEPWRECSTSCGKGVRRRNVSCKDTLNDIVMVDAFCKRKPRPKSSKSCERYQCKYAWIEGPWEPCSTSCGEGVKSRTVTCHRVYQGGVVDPVPLPETRHRSTHKNYCNYSKKPTHYKSCMVSRCGDEYVWQPDDWSACTHSCGRKGRQVRNLNCVSTRTKQIMPRHFCPKSLKPIKKRKCNQWKCMHKSCKEIKHYMQTKKNEDYIISLQGRPVSIYCYKMDTSEPQEYISLRPGRDNYAEIYDRRLMDLNSCPYGGQRRDNCSCDQIGADRSGKTTFWKVRINITSLEIISDDFTFSEQVKGTQIPYGTSGDCYSSHRSGCPQGKFSVDLTQTSFKIARFVKWKATGPYASKQIIRQSNTHVRGKCGGYCGECRPDGGLKVEIT